MRYFLIVAGRPWGLHKFHPEGVLFKGEAGLKQVTAIKGLRELNLRGTAVTDAGLKQVATLEELRELILQETDVTDAGLEALASVKGLQKLYLSRTKVTAEGIARLQKALPKCEITQIFID